MLAATVLALACVAAASAADGLVTRHSKQAGTVTVPASWRYRDASYLSDQSTELWADPENAKSRLKVEAKGSRGSPRGR